MLKDYSTYNSFSNNTFYNNSAVIGGAIYGFNTNIQFNNNNFTWNEATQIGGALELNCDKTYTTACKYNVTNSYFKDNIAST